VRASGRAALSRALEERRVLIVCGAGGVGKTTTAAALAVQAATDGRRVLVCTIDPSRRLATSLGLQKLPDKPRRLDLRRAVPDAAGEAWAMMLDQKRTFDELVERHMKTPEARDRVLHNRLYQKISSALAGSHEYMAMEKLLDLSADERFDLVVLDTPPTRHALDFLEAPDRMLGFLDTSILRWFLKPYFVAGRLTLKVATRTGKVALGMADRYLGLQFLADVSEFFLMFEDMYAGFKERAAAVHSLLRDPASGFVLVASPARVAIDEALYFHRRLGEADMPFVATVVNRVHPDPAQAAAEGKRSRRGAPAQVDPGLADALLQAYDDLRRLARAERRVISRLEVDTGEPLVLVPELESDVHDLRGLAHVAGLMLGEGAASGRAAAERGRGR
jgi:anion-transporting  ArsA/GET3 family ATPase